MLDSSNQKYIERYKDITPDWQGFLDSLFEPLPPVIWANTFKVTPEQLLESLSILDSQWSMIPWDSRGIKLDSSLRPGKFLEYPMGLFNIQEEVSALPAKVLDPKKDDLVLDICAAPGSKTVQMAMMMENRGTIVANDIKAQRIKLVRMSLARLGIMNVSTSVRSGAQLGPVDTLFDKVLVDVPCSCEGTSRKSSNVFRNPQKPFLSYRGGLQLAILRRAVSLCRLGGRIVYSTCTYRPEENEWVVDKILKDNNLKILNFKVDGLIIDPGVESWGGETFSKEVRKSGRIWPHRNNTGGFFVALFEKI